MWTNETHPHKSEFSVSASLNKNADVLSQSFQSTRMFIFWHGNFVGIIQMLNKLQLGKLLRFRRVTMTMGVFWFVVVPWLASNRKAITVCRFPPRMYIKIPADCTRYTSKDLHAKSPNIVCNNLYELWVAVESTIHSKLIGNAAYEFRFSAIHSLYDSCSEAICSARCSQHAKNIFKNDEMDFRFAGDADI